MTPSRWLRRRDRLAADIYRGPGAYSLTITTNRRDLYFRDAKIVRFCRATLERTSQEEGVDVLIYCFMPDHLHLLVQGRDGTEIPRFVKRFKQLTSYHFKRERDTTVLWQKGYYDYVLRCSEDVVKIAEYVLNNPVRAGLSATAEGFWFSSANPEFKNDVALALGQSAGVEDNPGY